MKTVMQPTRIIRALAVLVAASIASIDVHAACNIYMASNQQIIDGYGFSSAWCGTLSSAKNNALYGTLGMSILRIRIDENNNWNPEIANAQAAHAAGAKVLGTCWSVPSQWQTGNGELITADGGAYASWLNQAANAHNLDWVSPQNELDGAHWTPTDMLNFVKNNAPTVGRSIAMPEAINFQDQYSDPVLNDSVAVTHCSIVAGHLYGGGLYTHTNALAHGKHVWMTEYYMNGENDINTCMNLAKQISDCMNNQFSAYVWWWVNDNDTNVNLVLTSGTIFKNGYTIGQFAKWIRPGSTRVTADYNPQSNVYVTGYRVNGGTVIVAVNMGTSSVSQQFTIQNGNASTLEGYRTSSSQSMSDIGSFGVSGGSFTATLPAQSVTTFTQTGSTSGLANGTYKLIARHSGKAMDANGAATTNGTQIIQWTYHSGANEQWTVTSLGGGLYKIIGVQSGKSIDISNWGTANGTKVQLWDYLAGTNQKFFFNATSGGYYEISPSHATGSCLDVSGASTADGAIVQLWQYLGGNNQQWSPQVP
jgi:glucuronoarabinoxylan endo-1,4-beta-xylanase